MKTNIFKHFAKMFPKQVDVEQYRSQLQEFWFEYKNWWFRPLENFRKEYQEKHGNILDKNYSGAEDKFERELRSKDDLLARFFKFMDENYVVYMNATPKERTEIRNLVGKQGDLNYHYEDLIMKYVRKWTIQQLKSTGEKAWLLRGLVGMSIENSGIDYRDSLTSLAELYAVAEEKGIDPKNDFQKIADISSDETPAGGSTPMKKLMADIHSSAILREQKSQRK
ncbi:MAG: hypothetical protein EHM40_12455 [Chloroflexi bacterium]|nr:MAG: hypothetical protein EHM40_12455 [Chloroflexota bacterium]